MNDNEPNETVASEIEINARTVKFAGGNNLVSTKEIEANTNDDAEMQRENQEEEEEAKNGEGVAARKQGPATATPTRRRSGSLMTKSFVGTSNREYTAEIVTGLTQPMNPMQRRRREFLGQQSRNDSSILDGDSQRRQRMMLENHIGGAGRRSKNLMGNEKRKDIQFRLRSKGGVNGHGSDDFAWMNSVIESSGPFSLSTAFVSYIHWSFKTTLLSLLLSLTIIFFVLIILWTIIIFIAALRQPQCIDVGSKNFQSGGSYFLDAFALSWTTFSTVGYGLTGPSVSGTDRCIVFHMITAAEAFFGVLYAGFAGAVMFGKITHMNSVANVTWSDPIVIRYGPGVAAEKEIQKTYRKKMAAAAGISTSVRTNLSKEDGKEADGNDDDDEETYDDRIACPILEFRVINDFHHKLGAEIVDATINVWASTLAEYAPRSVLQAAGSSATIKDRLQKIPQLAPSRLFRRGASQTKRSDKQSTISDRSTVSISDRHADAGVSKMEEGQANTDKKKNDEHDHDHDDENKNDIDSTTDDRQPSCRKHLAVPEDSSNSGLLPRMIYSKLDTMSTDDHPYFKRIWIVRHCLNENSPLLDAEAQEKIAANGGYWPSEWNDYQSVRDHLVQFNEIMVTLSGTNYISGNTVYSHKTYEYVDVNIGWRFANALLVDARTRSLSVDVELINDVIPQSGGGEEPFHFVVDGDIEILNNSNIVYDHHYKGANNTDDNIDNNNNNTNHNDIIDDNEHMIVFDDPAATATTGVGVTSSKKSSTIFNDDIYLTSESNNIFPSTVGITVTTTTTTIKED